MILKWISTFIFFFIHYYFEIANSKHIIQIDFDIQFDVPNHNHNVSSKMPHHNSHSFVNQKLVVLVKAWLQVSLGFSVWDSAIYCDFLVRASATTTTRLANDVLFSFAHHVQQFVLLIDFQKTFSKHSFFCALKRRILQSGCKT